MSFLVRVVLFGSIVAAVHPSSTGDPAGPAGWRGTAEPRLVRPLRPQSGEGDDITAGAIDGARLVPFAPASLEGVPRSNLLEQVYAVAAAYQLPGGAYVNLDIQNVFPALAHLETEQVARCGRFVDVGGQRGCLTVSPGRASLRFYLPRRLVVIVAGPDEATVTRMARGLDLSGLAALART